jgi:hypothetical protein
VNYGVQSVVAAEISDGIREKRGVTLLDPPHATMSSSLI